MEWDGGVRACHTDSAGRRALRLPNVGVREKPAACGGDGLTDWWLFCHVAVVPAGEL